MASTWTSTKAVMAHTTKNGETRYSLHEQSTCSSVSPKIYNWYTHLYGTIEQVLEHIQMLAGHAEGGMLKGYGGRKITPAGYTRLWLTELTRPVAMPSTTITVHHPDFHEPGCTEHPALIAAVATLKKWGMSEQAAMLENGTDFELDLCEDSELVEALYPVRKSFTRRMPCPTGAEQPAPELAYKPAKAA